MTYCNQCGGRCLSTGRCPDCGSYIDHETDCTCEVDTMTLTDAQQALPLHQVAQALALGTGTVVIDEQGYGWKLRSIVPQSGLSVALEFHHNGFTQVHVLKRTDVLM